MSYRAKINELIEKLQLEMPIEVTLEDPVSGNEFTVKRENVLSLLLFNPEALVIESQTVAAFYAEMARLQRAAEFKRDRLESRFTKWKAQVSGSARHQKDEVTGKFPSEEKVKEAYRQLPEYGKYTKAIAQHSAMAGLFEDLKWAFNKKSSHVESVMRSVGGYEATEKSGSSSGTSSVSPEDPERLEELAGSLYRASAAEVENEMKKFWPSTQGEPEEETEDDTDEETEDEEFETDEETDEDDESDPDDPPPPPEPKQQSGPKKKSRKKKRTTKKKARARSTR